MIEQIKFRDKESGLIHGGILLEDGGIICACCGGYIEPDEDSVEILEVYDDWIDFSESICKRGI